MKKRWIPDTPAIVFEMLRLGLTTHAGRVDKCPLCGNPVRVITREDGSETAIRCTECQFSTTDGLDDPWQRSSPETVSCRYCHEDMGEKRVHARDCPWAEDH